MLDVERLDASDARVAGAQAGVELVLLRQRKILVKVLVLVVAQPAKEFLLRKLRVGRAPQHNVELPSALSVTRHVQRFCALWRLVHLWLLCQCLSLSRRET